MKALAFSGWFGALALPAAASVITVTNLQDSPGSLREALALAAAGDRIEFSVGGTIVLQSAPLAIAKQLTISGPGAARLVISGNHKMRVFEVPPSFGKVIINRLTIANGSGTVTASDIGQTKAQAVTASNFRCDVNLSGGSINSSDIGLVKAMAGTTLP